MTDIALTCGTGIWSGPKPGDPDNSIQLTASAAFNGVNLRWTYPTINPYAVAYVIVYRGLSTNFAATALIARVSGDNYFDASTEDVPPRYYYWVQLVSVNGTVAAAVGPASAQARPTVTDILEKLTSKIDAGVLSQSLKSQLDSISVINANLLQEVYDRETGTTTLAQAIQDANNGVAQAHTFIQQVSASRVTATSALAENINIVAATLGSDIAASVITSGAYIDQETHKLGALYTAKVTVNGLVGGFGVYNDGTSVEAGFDVDTFWVGRTSQNKRKPFIIKEGVTYIESAMISKLVADQIDSRGLSIKDADGNIILSAGNTLGNQVIAEAPIGMMNADAIATAAADATAKANIAATTANWTGVSNRPNSVATLNTADGIALATAAAKALEALNTSLKNNADNVLGGVISANVVGSSVGFRAGTLTWDIAGNRTGGYGVAMSPKGFAGYNQAGQLTFAIDASTGNATFGGSLSAATGTFAGDISAASGTFNGTLSANSAQVNTLNIAGNAATTMAGANGTNYASVVVDIGGVSGDTYNVMLLASAQQPSVGYFDLLDNGVLIARGLDSGLTAMSIKTTAAAGSTHTYAASPNFGIQCSLTVLVSRR